MTKSANLSDIKEGSLKKVVYRVMKRNSALIKVYYVFMLILLLLMSRPEASYSLMMRVVYMGLIVIPLFFFPKLIPAVVICFWGICSNSFYALLPDNYLFLIPILFLLIIVNFKEIKNSLFAPLSYYLLFLFTLIISLSYADYEQNFLKVSFLFLLIFPFVQSGKDVFNLSLGICLMSFCLAIIYLLNFSYFMTEIDKTDFEIGAWGNQNVLSGAVSCGFPIAMAILLGIIKGKVSLLLKVFLIGGMFLILVVVFSVGSRGSLSAIAVSSFFLLFSINGNMKKKVIILVLLILSLFCIYYLGFMDYIIYRFTELDTNETVGGRSIIWETKISAFIETDIITILVGMGRRNCDLFGVIYSTHNDFVTALVGFGCIGFIIFILFVLTPLLYAKKKNVIPIFALWIFIFLESIVLEPFFRGYIPFYAFYILLLKLSSSQSGIIRDSFRRKSYIRSAVVQNSNT